VDTTSIFEPVVKAGISHVIQLSVAPVFLLTSVGAILNVMSNRLSRVVDRARALEVKLEGADAARAQDIHRRLQSLSQRARLLGQSISLCVLTAVLVCAVIITLFVGEFAAYNFVVPAALLFIAALLAFLLSLVWLLREIFMATSTLRFGPG
jgi:hypothetical protein